MVYWLFIHGFVIIQPRGLLRKLKDAKKPKNNAAAMPRMQGKRPLPHARKRAKQASHKCRDLQQSALGILKHRALGAPPREAAGIL